MIGSGNWRNRAKHPCAAQPGSQSHPCAAQPGSQSHVLHNPALSLSRHPRQSSCEAHPEGPRAQRSKAFRAGRRPVARGARPAHSVAPARNLPPACMQHLRYVTHTRAKQRAHTRQRESRVLPWLRNRSWSWSPSSRVRCRVSGRHLRNTGMEEGYGSIYLQNKLKPNPASPLLNNHLWGPSLPLS